MSDDLLDALVRPDNLVEHQLNKEMEFGREHLRKLGDVEKAVNSSMGAIVDGPSDPILLGSEPFERVEVSNMFHTSEKPFDKIATVFSALAEEVSFLKLIAEGRFYSQLTMFGFNKNDNTDEYGDGLLESMLARSLPTFQNLTNLVDRINSVVLNTINQLNALFSKTAGFAESFKESSLTAVVLFIGDALTILHTLDLIISNNRYIASSWEKYRRLVDVMRIDPAKYGASPEKAKFLDEMLLRMESIVISGKCLQSCLDQKFDEFEDGPFAREYLRELIIENVDTLLESIGSSHELDESTQLVGQVLTFSLYLSLSRGRSPLELQIKLFDKLYKLVEHHPVIPLHLTTCFLIDQYLISHCVPPGYNYTKILKKSGDFYRTQFIEGMEQQLQSTANTLHSKTHAYLVRAKMFFSNRTLHSQKETHEFLRLRSNIGLQALYLASSGQRTVQTYISLQLLMRRPFRKSSLDAVVRMCEALKTLEASVRAGSPELALAVAPAAHDCASAIVSAIQPLKLRAQTARKKEGSMRFVSAAAEAVQRLCVSTEGWTPLRRRALAFCVSVACTRGTLDKETRHSLRRSMQQLEAVSVLATAMRRRCDCSVLYLVREIFPTVIHIVLGADKKSDQTDKNATNSTDSRHGQRLQHVLTAFSDAARVLAHLVHLPPPPLASHRAIHDFSSYLSEANQKAIESDNSGLLTIEHPLTAYERFLIGSIHHELVEPLARYIETDLRLAVHAVHLSHMEAPSARSGRASHAHLLQLAPLRVVGALVSIKQAVTQSLERIFYELTTVALHDWRTYGEMTALAAHKYGLVLTDNHLPMGCLDTGLDVLQIMRNIHVFVSRFNYNMNQQFFVEKKTLKGGKHINVVSIQSVLSSIRQHGSGMMNTTVNFVYQFLAQKFHILAQFLYDDYIKSYLAKERRFYKRERKALENRYPYSHAVALRNDIRGLGLSADKLSFLDKFRQLVSEIGNALGYVRMVRTAGMHAAADTVKFVPDLENLISFAEAAKQKIVTSAVSDDSQQPTEGHLSPETVLAAEQLDAVLANLTSSFAEGSDYFKILVSVFQHVLAGKAEAAANAASATDTNGQLNDASKSGSKEDSHLRNFFLTIPALTLSFVENLRSSKDRLEKSVKGAESFFTDDGFAMGLAYILSILKQKKLFDSLRWWDSVKIYHSQELQKAKAELPSLSKSKADADKSEELQFKIARVQTMQTEMDQLFYAFQGATAFFRTDASMEEEEMFVAV